MSSALPKWIQTRISEINQRGKLDLSQEARFNPECFKLKSFSPYLKLIRVIDLSNTSITDLTGFVRFPSLSTFIANHTPISSFANFSILKGITKISLKQTPISNNKSYQLSITTLLMPEISIIDGKIISDSLKQKAQKLGKLTASLLDSGWIMPFPIPNSYEIMDECHKRGINVDSSDFDDLSSDETENSELTNISDDFNEETVSENDKQLANGISNIFADFGIDIDPTNYRELLATIADILP